MQLRERGVMVFLRYRDNGARAKIVRSQQKRQRIARMTFRTSANPQKSAFSVMAKLVACCYCVGLR
jgi:hypothetical protein